jgi:hypothetical protein
MRRSSTGRRILLAQLGMAPWNAPCWRSRYTVAGSHTAIPDLRAVVAR